MLNCYLIVEDASDALADVAGRPRISAIFKALSRQGMEHAELIGRGAGGTEAGLRPGDRYGLRGISEVSAHTSAQWCIVLDVRTASGDGLIELYAQAESQNATGVRRSDGAAIVPCRFSGSGMPSPDVLKAAMDAAVPIVCEVQPKVDTAPRPIAFLDRDGVLNREVGYLHRQQDLEWMPGAIPLVRWLNERRFHVVVATNQAGIGRGYYTREQFAILMRAMRRDLAAAGAWLDRVYHAPHHPGEGLAVFRRRSADRKPAPGMLLRGLAELGGRRDGSIFIGDRETDMEAAKDAGINGILVTNGNIYEQVMPKLNSLSCDSL